MPEMVVSPRLLLAVMSMFATMVAVVLPTSIVGVHALPVYTFPYVYGVSPAGITNMDSTSTLTILGGRLNDKFFLVHNASSNCSSPAPYSTGKRTWLATLNRFGEASFASQQLVPGTYYVCYQGARRVNGTNSSYPTYYQNYARNVFSPLPYRVLVGGPVDTGLSDFTCCGPFRAGDVANCTVYLRDGFGNPTGSSNTSCRLSLCPFLDGRGQTIADYVPPSMVLFGTFFVSFLPTGAGCAATVGVKYNGFPIAAKQAYFSVKAGPAASNRSTSSCSVLANGTTVCTIAQRDYYDNVIQLCTYNSAGGTPVCNVIN